MIVREVTAHDIPKIEALHRRSGFVFDLDTSSEGLFSRRVVSDGDRIAMAAFLKRTAEVVLVCDRDWKNPAWRAEALRQLQEICEGDCRHAGIAEVNCFLVPSIAKNFGRRLTRMGWKNYGSESWKCFSFDVRKQ